MAEEPLRLVQFTKSFHIGGTEVQVVELLRGLPPCYRVQVAVLQDAGPLMDSVLGWASRRRCFRSMARWRGPTRCCRWCGWRAG